MFLQEYVENSAKAMEALKQRQSGAVADNTKIIKVAEAEADD
jgi:hypothetical protein